MKANELRIGNLINITSTNKVFESFITDVKGYNIVRCEEKAFNYWSYEPIPLTEEWLLRFGYFKVEHKQVNFIVKGHTIWICNNLYLCEKNGIILKYVHQLQNLYFALTNEELIIKL